MVEPVQPHASQDEPEPAATQHNSTTQVRILEAQLAEKDHYLTALSDQIHRNDEEILALKSELQRWQDHCVQLESSQAWKLARRFRSIRAGIAPVGSARESAWLAGLSLIAAWKAGGIQAVVPTALESIRGRSPSTKRTPYNDSYTEWAQRTEPTDHEFHEQREETERLPYRPLITVIICAGDVDSRPLSASLESIGAQTYGDWEIILVADGTGENRLWELVTHLVAQRDSLRTRFLREAITIVPSLTGAQERVQGEFVWLMRGGDVLAANALFEVALMLNSRPSADVVYCDDDEYGDHVPARFNPFFKPDWSPEMLLSVNYLEGSVVRTRLWHSAGGFALPSDSLDLWGVLLCATELTDAIEHIPKVLYHHRANGGARCRAKQQLAQPSEHQIQQITEHLQRQGIEDAEATIQAGQLRVVWPNGGSKVSIIIPTKDRVDLLNVCLSSIFSRTAYRNFEVVLVDSGSKGHDTQEYYSQLAQNEGIRVVNFDLPFNYSRVNNLGAREASGDLLLFLNNDVEVLDSGWLEELLRWAEQPSVGAVGGKLLFPTGTIQHAGIIVGMGGHAGHIFSGADETECGPFGSPQWYRNYMAVTGACMMMRRSVFDEVGGFDEQYQVTFSDVSICMHVLERGYRNVYTPFATLRHHESASRVRGSPPGDLQRGYQEFERIIQDGDRYFNPNLSFSTPIPTIAGPDELPRGLHLRRLLGV